MCGSWSFCGSTCHNGKYPSLLVCWAWAWLNLHRLNWVALGSHSIRWLMMLLSLPELSFSFASKEPQVSQACAVHSSRELEGCLKSWSSSEFRADLASSLSPRILCYFSVFDVDSCSSYQTFFFVSVLCMAWMDGGREGKRGQGRKKEGRKVGFCVLLWSTMALPICSLSLCFG